MKTITFLSLFSGVGGFDLGLERAGMVCVGQVEIEPYCRAVLAKHWPHVKRLEDVRAVKGDEFGPVDLVVGGVPCQPASCAGKRKGREDERWLWPEFVRIVRATGCAGFIAENVRGFLSLPAAGGVVRELEGAGYEVRTLLLGAHHVGAPHRRDRIWIVGKLADGHSRGLGRAQSSDEVNGSVVQGDGQSRDDAGAEGEHRAGMADTEGSRREGDESTGLARAGRRAGEHGACRWPSRPGEPQHEWEAPRLVYANGRGSDEQAVPVQQRGSVQACFDAARAMSVGVVGPTQSRVGVAVDELPRRLAGFGRRNALKALGNAVVPQVAEVIGRAVIEAMKENAA